MDQIEIGLWVTAGLLVMVIMGMRVAFAAALAGVVGLVLIFWSKKDFDDEYIINFLDQMNQVINLLMLMF